MPKTLVLSKRCPEITALVQRVAGARRVVVVTGAGISVNSGIPDFRSSDGLFRQIQAAHGGLVSKGRDLFDASVVFQSAQTAEVFYQWMTQLRRQCASAQPGVVHRFLRQLADRGMLLRSYTQNIDGLERKAGLAVWDPYSHKDAPGYVSWQEAQSVPLHGSMDRLACQLCAGSFPFSEQSNATMVAGSACADCVQRSETREACGRRSLPAGKLRPTVVLYEEPHPHCEDIARIISHDARALGARRAASKVDVVLVFGTTLKVPGCRQLVRRLATASPDTTTILVNNEPICGRAWDGIIDYQIVGCVDEWCARIQRQWSLQTKITRWARPRKSASVARKENALSSCDDAPKPSRKRCRSPEVDVTSSTNCAAVRYAPKKRQVTQEAPTLPARRSVRIAIRKSVENYPRSQPISVCLL